MANPTTSPRVPVASGECRCCSLFCDKMIDPVSCIELGCRHVYTYEDRWEGRRFVGCLKKVYRAEVDLEALRPSAGRKNSLGGIRVLREPMPWCPFTVEHAFPNAADVSACVNRRFLDYGHGDPLSYRVADRREVLPHA